MEDIAVQTDYVPRTGSVIFTTASKLWAETTLFQHKRFCQCQDPVGHLQQWLGLSDTEPGREEDAGQSEGGGEDIDSLLEAFTEDSER